MGCRSSSPTTTAETPIHICTINKNYTHIDVIQCSWPVPFFLAAASSVGSPKPSCTSNKGAVARLLNAATAAWTSGSARMQSALPSSIYSIHMVLI